MNLEFLIIVIFCLTQCRSQQCDYYGAHQEDISAPCLHQLQIACTNGSVLLRMFDASSKYPITGMSYSNNRDLGNFDQCIDLKYESKDGRILGKYCGLNVAIINPYLHPIPDPFETGVTPKNLAQVNSTEVDNKEGIDDYLITLLSVCIPDQCTPAEVGKYFIGTLLDTVPLIQFPDRIPCATKETNTQFEWGDIVFTTFLALIAFFIVASTTYDYIIQKLEQKSRHPLFLAFSVLTNGQKLLHIAEQQPGQIACLNGLRFISMMWVVCGHGYVAFEKFPILNYKEIDGFVGNSKVSYIGAAPISVDTFFFLSGFLLTFGYLKASGKKPVLRQLTEVPLMYIHRYLRLTPALAVLYFATITIFRMLGAGPLWGIMTQEVNQQCVNNWWAFFLYLQNYVNYNDMCFFHTWYLSGDMQLFILAPIVLVPLTVLVRKNKMQTVYYGLGVLIVLAVGFPMLSRFLDHTIDNVYDAHSRICDYLVGIVMGVIMRDPRLAKFPFSKLVNLAIWCFVLVVGVLFNLYYLSIINVYYHTSDTLFYGLYRPVWCSSLAWMVYSCYHGRGGPINWILSLPIFQIGARLSYCIYLLHAVVQMYWVGIIRTQFYWGDFMGFYLWCGHFFVSTILATVWTLAFESPMIVIAKWMMGGGRSKQSQQKSK